MTEKLPVFPLKDYWILIVLGIFLGVLGHGYEWVVLRIGKAYQGLGKIFHLPSHFHGLLAVPLIIPIGLYFPYLLGGGNELILALNGLHPALTVAILYLAIRFIWSMLSFGSGFPGGIFLPILALGSLLGAAIGALCVEAGFITQEQFPIFIILGMSGYFGAISKAPLTAMILVTEMVGDIRNLMPLGLVTLMAYIAMDLLKGAPVYEAMLEKMLPDRIEDDGETTLIEIPVSEKIAGRQVHELELPHGVLITMNIHKGKTQTVNGASRLYLGDTIYVVVKKSEIGKIKDTLL